MNRFDIAIAKKQGHERERGAIRFPATKNPSVIAKYIRLCIERGKDFDTTNLPESALQHAVISVAKTYRVPILMKDSSTARSCAIAYKFSSIYGPEDWPKTESVAIVMPNTKVMEGLSPLVKLMRF